jgi:hypothetical protein
MMVMIPWSFRVPVKSSLVNRLPCSVLKISGGPYREDASSSASTQKSVPSVFDSRQPCRHPTRAVIRPGEIGPVDHRHDRTVVLADLGQDGRYRLVEAMGTLMTSVVHHQLLSDFSCSQRVSPHFRFVRMVTAFR